MINVQDDLLRRRPIWEALSDLFLDNDVQELGYRFIANRIVESGYCPSEINSILWDELFPVLEHNLRDVAGEWALFPIDWLEKRILGECKKSFPHQQPRIAALVLEAWRKDVIPYLPAEFAAFEAEIEFWQQARSKGLSLLKFFRRPLARETVDRELLGGPLENQWTALKERMQATDEIWPCECHDQRDRGLRRGYVVVRNGRVIGGVITGLS